MTTKPETKKYALKDMSIEALKGHLKLIQDQIHNLEIVYSNQLEAGQKKEVETALPEARATVKAIEAEIARKAMKQLHGLIHDIDFSK